MQNKILRYIWLIPATYVSYQFGGKLFEVLADNTEITDIISVIHPLIPVSKYLAYFIGLFDMFITVLLLIIPLLKYTKNILSIFLFGLYFGHLYHLR